MICFPSKGIFFHVAGCRKEGFTGIHCTELIGDDSEQSVHLIRLRFCSSFHLRIPREAFFPFEIRPIIFSQGRESAEELTSGDKENLRGKILQIFEEDENVEVFIYIVFVKKNAVESTFDDQVYMEDDEGNIQFVGRNRAMGDPRQEERKEGARKRQSREEEGRRGKDSRQERKHERQRKQSSEKESTSDYRSDLRRKDGLFPAADERLSICEQNIFH